MKPNNVIPFRSLQLTSKKLFIEPVSAQDVPPSLTLAEERSLLRALQGKLNTVLSVAEDYEHPLYGKALATGVSFCLKDIKKLLVNKGVAHV